MFGTVSIRMDNQSGQSRVLIGNFKRNISRESIRSPYIKRKNVCMCVSQRTGIHKRKEGKGRRKKLLWSGEGDTHDISHIVAIILGIGYFVY